VARMARIAVRSGSPLRSPLASLWCLVSLRTRSRSRCRQVGGESTTTSTARTGAWIRALRAVTQSRSPRSPAEPVRDEDRASRLQRNPAGDADPRRGNGGLLDLNACADPSGCTESTGDACADPSGCTESTGGAAAHSSCEGLGVQEPRHRWRAGTSSYRDGGGGELEPIRREGDGEERHASNDPGASSLAGSRPSGRLAGAQEREAWNAPVLGSGARRCVQHEGLRHRRPDEAVRSVTLARTRLPEHRPPSRPIVWWFHGRRNRLRCPDDDSSYLTPSKRQPITGQVSADRPPGEPPPPLG
jgi:hypothetical protein